MNLTHLLIGRVSSILLAASVACLFGLAPRISAQTVLIASNAVWAYLSDGSDQDTAWREPNLDDDEWDAGPAELGYGDAGSPDFRPETTVLPYGPDPNNKPVTCYFRHWFYIANPAAISNLVAGLVRDDGAVVYLNGVEIIRSNLPAGPITYQTPASPVGNGPEEFTFFPSPVDPELLLPGWNLMAVEVHQHHPASADLSFALELLSVTGEPPPPPASRVVRGPYLQIGTTTNIIVRWRTSEPTDSRVRYGLANLALAVHNAEITTDHVITLPNLTPDTEYFYAVGSSSTNFPADASHRFRTAPVHAKPTRIWAIGDAGAAFNQPDYSSYGVVQNQMGVRDAYYAFEGARPTDLWLVLGDNAYNNGLDGEYQTNFFQIYPDLLRRSVVWPTPGNHEVQGLTGDVGPYLDMFSLPVNGEAGGVASGNEHYYSFNYGNIHFVSLDSEVSPRQPGGPMLTWLEADLAANLSDWLIVYWHSPPYTKGSHDSDYEFHLYEMRQNVVPILEAYGVDLVLCGHSHNYERSHLIDGHYGSSFSWTATMARDSGSGQPEDTGAYRKAGLGANGHEGTVYVVAGSSGWAWPTAGLNHPAMFRGLQRLGSMVLDVDGNRLDAKFLRETGAIDDSFTIVKGVAPEPLRIVTFRRDAATTIIRWKSIAGHSYRVQITADPGNPNWQNVSPPITATGATTSWTNATPNNLPAAFYRVVDFGD